MTGSSGEPVRHRQEQRFAPQKIVEATVWGNVVQIQNAGDGPIDVRNSLHVHPPMPRHYEALLRSGDVTG